MRVDEEIAAEIEGGLCVLLGIAREDDGATAERRLAAYFALATTESFGANPVARAAALRLCATGAAGISPTEPQRSQIRNATIEVSSWSCAQARKALRLSMR